MLFLTESFRGHYYFRENCTAESQGLAFLKFANFICETGKTASELLVPLRKYYPTGEINSEVKDPKNAMLKIRKKYYDANMLEFDGLTIEYDDLWFNVRPANTEPLLRLNLEASTKTNMEKKRDEFLHLIRN